MPERRKRDPAFQVLIPADDLANYRKRARRLGVGLGAVIRDLLARAWPMERGRVERKVDVPHDQL